jgi:hypothetical protein
LERQSPQWRSAQCISSAKIAGIGDYRVVVAAQRDVRELRTTNPEMLEQILSTMDPDKTKRVERLDRQDWDYDVRNYVKKRTAAMTDEQVEQALEFTLKEMEQRRYNEAQIELMRTHWGTIIDGDEDILDQIALLGE